MLGGLGLRGGEGDGAGVVAFPKLGTIVMNFLLEYVFAFKHRQDPHPHSAKIGALQNKILTSP